MPNAVKRKGTGPRFNRSVHARSNTETLRPIKLLYTQYWNLHRWFETRPA